MRKISAYFCGLNSLILTFKLKLKQFFSTVLPENRTEGVLLILLIAAYGSFASYIAWRYRIVFDDRIPWDAYFSFDNRSIVMTGGGFERHPLANYFFNAIRNVALWFSDGKKDQFFRLALALPSAVAISFSNLYLYKYLRNIIRLPKVYSWLLILFFACFTTNILLSFTPETYTYTLLLLSLFNYYAALKLRNNRNIPATALTFATVSVGGLTITNAAKVFIPLIFEKDTFQSPRKFLDAALRGMVAVAVFILLYLNRLNFDYHRIFDKTGEQYEKFSKPKVTPVWDMVASWFIGGNVLFPGFVVRDYHNRKGFAYKALFMDVYTSWLPYVFVGVLLVLVLWSVLKNRRNSLVAALFLSFLADVVIHCVLKFGLHTSYIYGGHFVFVYPLLLGWLFYAYRERKDIFTGIFSVFLMLFSYMAFCNLFRLTEFLAFLDRYYQ